MEKNTLTQKDIIAIITALQDQLDYLHQECDDSELTQRLINDYMDALVNIRKLKEPD